jgi:dihydrolipoamide dehydrogenase
VLPATGSVAKSLPGLEIDADRIISSDPALVLDRVPKSAIILGGGVIGVECASASMSFGADVTVTVRSFAVERPPLHTGIHPA